MGLAEFIEYCELNRIKDAHPKRERWLQEGFEPHDIWVSRIYDDSRLVGIEDIDYKYMEVPLIDNPTAEYPETIVDLVLVRDSKVYLCEIKSTRDEKLKQVQEQKRKACKQLGDQYGWVLGSFDVDPYLIRVIVSENYLNWYEVLPIWKIRAGMNKELKE